MKKFYVITAINIMAACAVFAQDANSIVRASRDRIKADTISSQSLMIITSKSGATTERSINQYSKDDADGKSRVLVEFLSPASVKGTRFLSTENQNGGEDRWIYLPELNRVRRIAAAEGSGSFMGTDLSYDDVSSADREIDKDKHKFVREESLNGKVCYVIESTPKDTSYQYSKMISWIDKTTSALYKLELYNKKGNLQKLFETIELKDVQGRLSPWVTKMTNVASGSFTTIYVQKLKYDSALPDGMFTTNYLETGRAQ
jgi:outer membrane lipoprotein-sorting protein